jgi:nucleoside-diphosphate-sugar epimerase
LRDPTHHANQPQAGRATPYLLTGASGFIGSHLAEALVARGAIVHCLLLPGDPAPNLSAVRDQIHIHRADLLDAEALQGAVRAASPEVVMHLAAVGVTDVHVDPALAVRVNVVGTLNLLAALDGAYRVFLNVGTCHEYGDGAPPFREDQDPRPSLAYAITKTAVWHFCRRFHDTEGWPIVTARPFSVYGPRQAGNTFIPACIHAARRGVDFEMTAGEQGRDWIYVTDVVEGMIRATSVATAIGGTFNLCTGRETALYDVARAIVQGLGDPVAIHRGALSYREGEIWHLVGDNTRARAVLGWEPTTALADGLRRTIAAISTSEVCPPTSEVCTRPKGPS